MPTLPRVVVEAFEQKADGPDAPRLPIGPQDLTRPVISMIVRDGRLPRRGIAIIDIHEALTPEASRVAWQGNLALPGLEEACAAFATAIGGIDNVGAVRTRLAEISRARLALDLACRVESHAASARIDGMPSPDDMVLDPYDGSDDGYREFSDHMLGGTWAREYEAASPPPYDDDGRPGPSMGAWAARRDDARRAGMCPFVFGTRGIAWAGIDPKDLRTAFADDGDVDLDALIDSGMEEHHDDARDHVVGEEALRRLVARWLPHANSGDAEDLALEGNVAAWNGRQVLSSYEADRSVVRPAFPDLTREEILAHCASRVAAARATLAHLEGTWEPPAPRPVAA